MDKKDKKKLNENFVNFSTGKIVIFVIGIIVILIILILLGIWMFKKNKNSLSKLDPAEVSGLLSATTTSSEAFLLSNTL